jgi:hypothetical protein
MKQRNELELLLEHVTLTGEYSPMDTGFAIQVK